VFPVFRRLSWKNSERRITFRMNEDFLDLLLPLFQHGRFISVPFEEMLQLDDEREIRGFFLLRWMVYFKAAIDIRTVREMLDMTSPSYGRVNQVIAQVNRLVAKYNARRDPERIKVRRNPEQVELLRVVRRGRVTGIQLVDKQPVQSYDEGPYESTAGEQYDSHHQIFQYPAKPQHWKSSWVISYRNYETNLWKQASWQKVRTFKPGTYPRADGTVPTLEYRLATLDEMQDARQKWLQLDKARKERAKKRAAFWSMAKPGDSETHTHDGSGRAIRRRTLPRGVNWREALIAQGRAMRAERAEKTKA
jgi:hypothetical protein